MDVLLLGLIALTVLSCGAGGDSYQLTGDEYVDPVDPDE